jgi:hypothetical protein
MHGKKGHLWRARFSSRIVTEEDDFLNVLKDIDDNPVKMHIVSDARKWRYGGRGIGNSEQFSTKIGERDMISGANLGATGGKVPGTRASVTVT